MDNLEALFEEETDVEVFVAEEYPPELGPEFWESFRLILFHDIAVQVSPRGQRSGDFIGCQDSLGGRDLTDPSVDLFCLLKTEGPWDTIHQDGQSVAPDSACDDGQDPNKGQYQP